MLRVPANALGAKAVLSGLATYMPGYDYMRRTGGTDSARYCYAVWLRHLILANESFGAGLPTVVAELGPGDSIGIGLAALLCGAEKYYALDVVPYSDLRSNLRIFDELVRLFEQREPVPGESEFPLLYPKLRSYEFPAHLLDEPHLREALRSQRVAEIRSSVERADAADSRILYKAPWAEQTVIENDCVDMIYSQAVLEHVQELRSVYEAMSRWLKRDGVMSHQIDYQCHGKANVWNGHWTYSDLLWKLIVGRRPYLLNREPHSEHVKLLREAGFRIVSETRVRSASTLRARDLAAGFRGLSEDDLTTSGAFLVATLAE